MHNNKVVGLCLFTVARKTADVVPDNIDKACGVEEKCVRTFVYKSKFHLSSLLLRSFLEICRGHFNFVLPAHQKLSRRLLVKSIINIQR